MDCVTQISLLLSSSDRKERHGALYIGSAYASKWNALLLAFILGWTK